MFMQMLQKKTKKVKTIKNIKKCKWNVIARISFKLSDNLTVNVFSLFYKILK